MRLDQLLPALLAVSLLACGDDSTEPAGVNTQSSGIIGGQRSHASDDPEVGALMHGGPLPARYCTGTLIAPDVVLTAAHCTATSSDIFTNTARSQRIRFTLDTNISTAPVQHMVQVRSAHVHPEYRRPLTDRAPETDEEHALVAEVAQRCPKPESRAPSDIASWLQCLSALPEDLRTPMGFFGGLHQVNDVALLFLETPIRDVTPANLPSRQVARDYLRNTGHGLRVVGYGLQSEDSDAALYAHQDRRSLSAPLISMASHEMRLSSAPPQACSGDSGGPALWPGAPPRTVLGVASRVYFTGTPPNPLAKCTMGVIYTRVDPYIEWIEATMQDACASGERMTCYHPTAGEPHEGCAASGASPWVLLGVVALLLMRRRALAPLALCVCMLPRPAGASDPAMIDAGPLNSKTPYPQVGALIGARLCTATLVQPDVALTAASCWGHTEPFAPEDVAEFFVGPHLDAIRPDELYAVRWVIPHPEYAPSFSGADAYGDAANAVRAACGSMPLTEFAHAHQRWLRCAKRQPRVLQEALHLEDGVAQDHDLALVILDRPVLTAYPAKLPKRDAKLSRDLVAVGYGQRVQRGGSEGWSKMFVGAKAAVRQNLDATGPWEFSVAAANQPCDGDVGAPAFDQAQGDHALVGLVSRSYDRQLVTDCRAGMVYTRIQPHVDWIRSELTEACNHHLRTGCNTASDDAGGCAAAPPSWWAALLVALALRRFPRIR